LEFQQIFNTATLTTFAIWFVVSWYYHGIGITLGYHRLLTHKALKLPKLLTYLICSGGYFCLMGGPINWVGTHRLHHQKSDMDGDPHSPVHGFKHALYEWMFTMGDKQSDEEIERQVPDLLQDPFLVSLGVHHEPKQAQRCLILSILFRVLILAVFGWVPMVANLAATFMVFWSPQLVNSVCHMKNHGYRLFETRDESRNVWWVAIMACGEGWHNNHHAVPRSAQHGMAWWEFDVTWLTILFLEKIGLAKDVVKPQSLEIEQKRLQRAYDIVSARKSTAPISKVAIKLAASKASEKEVDNFDYADDYADMAKIEAKEPEQKPEQEPVPELVGASKK